MNLEGTSANNKITTSFYNEQNMYAKTSFSKKSVYFFNVAIYFKYLPLIIN